MPTESRDPIYRAVRAAVLALPDAPADLAEYKMEVVPVLWPYLPVEAEGGGVPITRAPWRETDQLVPGGGVLPVTEPTPHRRILPEHSGNAGGYDFRAGWDEWLRTVAVWIP